MDRKKKTLLILGVFIMVVALTGVSVAFFNYTRTGTANTISVGNISFTSSQNGNINLTNAFPIASSTIDNTPIDEDNIGVVSVDISGSTSYSGGIEYVVTVDNFNNTTLNNKKIPVSIATSVEGRNSKTLGTSTSAYFDENVRENSNVAIYRKTDYTNVFEDEQLLVGYIPKDIEVDGTLSIKAYIDKDRVAISDTYDGRENDNMGTTRDWANSRTLFTTSEWNNLQENGISFNIKVEANEGIWVKEVNSINVSSKDKMLINYYGVKEIYFVKLNSSTMESRFNNATIKSDATDYSDSSNTGTVLAWLEDDLNDSSRKKLFIASNGETYLTDGYALFSGLYNLEKIEFNNVNTSRITKMSGIFNGCSSLVELDLRSFDTKNVSEMDAMFMGCSKLKSINLSSFDTRNVNVTPVMFQGDTALETIYVSNSWNVSDVSNSSGMFAGCASLVGTSPNGTTYAFTDYNTNDKTYAVIATDTTAGYLTDVSLKPTT